MKNKKTKSDYEPYDPLQPTPPDWEHLDLHLDELMEKEDWSSIAVYVADNERLLLSRWMSEERASLDISLKKGNLSLALVSGMLSMEEKLNSVFRIGSLYGMLQLLNKQIKYEKEELYSVQIAEKALSSVKNLDEIVLLLEQNGTLTHSSLARKLGNMKAPTLTDNMKKVISRGLVYDQIYGRFKQYYLTDTGRIYARNLRKRQNTSMDLERVENLLESWLKDSTKTESVQEMLIRLWNPKEDTKQKELQRTVLFSKSDNVGTWARIGREQVSPFEIRIMNRSPKARITDSESVKSEALIVKPLDQLINASIISNRYQSTALEQSKSVHKGKVVIPHKIRDITDMLKKTGPEYTYSLDSREYTFID